MDRRHFLKSASATIALPGLEAMGASADASDVKAKNFIAIGCYLGWHQGSFFPTEAGSGYQLSPTLQPLAEHRDQFTVFSGLDHRAPNGHKAWTNFLSGHQPGAYSLDQMVADSIGGESRFASLELATGVGEGAKTMSFTKQGVGLPTTIRPSVLYRRLFATEADRERTEYLIKSGQSALDGVVDDARRLQKSLPTRDREKLDEFFTSMRAVEGRLQRQLKSLDEPLERPDYELPAYDPITPNLQMEAGELMYDLIVLALDSGATRVASVFLDGLGQVFALNGRTLKAGYHALSHHGNDTEMVSDLVSIEQAHMAGIAGLLRQLSEKRDVSGRSLLEDTVVLVGTGMGDASRHSNANLPTLVAGGGYKHGQHLNLGEEGGGKFLLGDLYLTLMQGLGMEVGSFANASRNLNHVFS